MRRQAEGDHRGTHARSHGLVCTFGITHYPSLASAEVAEDSADSGRSLSVGIRVKKIRGKRAAEKSAALFVVREANRCESAYNVRDAE